MTRQLDQQPPAADGPAPAKEFLDSFDLEKLTGTPSSTWRFWASSGAGPASFKLGRRRVWRRDTVLAWLAAQERAAGLQAP